MSTLIRYDASYTRPVFGLVNFNNNCWLNTLIQILLGCPSFNKIITQHSEIVKSLKRNKCASEYINIYNGTSTNAARLWMLLSGSADPQCIDEAFTLFLEALKYNVLENLFLIRVNKKIICPRCAAVTSDIADVRYITDCYISRDMPKTTEEFCDYIRATISPVTDYTCEKCKVKHEVIDRVEAITRLGEIIIIRFKDKFYNGTKYPIWYPDTLEFNANNGNKLKYKLIGEILHLGSAEGGHYAAVTRRNEQNYLISDMQYSEISPAIHTNAVMVIYHYC